MQVGPFWHKMYTSQILPEACTSRNSHKAGQGQVIQRTYTRDDWLTCRDLLRRVAITRVVLLEKQWCQGSIVISWPPSHEEQARGNILLDITPLTVGTASEQMLWPIWLIRTHARTWYIEDIQVSFYKIQDLFP
jgi:hypothetical protein